jgi:hypothetical protein
MGRFSQVSNKRRTAMLSADTFAVTAAGQFGSGAGQFAVVQPAVASSARWLLSIDSLPTHPAGAAAAAAAAQPAAGLPICSINLWVCIDTDVLSMSPSSPNPTSTVYVIYQSQQGRQATISTASGHSQPIADGALKEGDHVTGEKTALFSRFILKRSFCQDRLGTNIGKTPKGAVFPQSSWSNGMAFTSSVSSRTVQANLMKENTIFRFAESATFW